MNSEHQCVYVNVNNHDERTADIQAIADSFKRISARLNEILQSESFRQTNQAIADSFKQIATRWNDILQSESFHQTIANLRDVINSILTTKWADLSLTTGEAIQQINYINFAQEIKWPIYHIHDDALRIALLNIDPSNSEEIRTTILSHFSNDRVFQISEKWQSSKAVVADRMPLLQEAITLHCRHYYYASTSMLMCQVYGIEQDIRTIVKKANIGLTEQEKDELSDLYNIKRDKIDGEKGQLLQMFMLPEEEILMWGVAIDYLWEEVLCSSESKERWKRQPIRNKICHGDQLNFGTEEHSLKAILTIDLLIRLADEIDRITHIQEDEQV